MISFAKLIMTKKKCKQKGKGVYEDWVDPVLQGASNFMETHRHGFDVLGNIADIAGYNKAGRTFQQFSKYGADVGRRREQEHVEDVERFLRNNPQRSANLVGSVRPTSYRGQFGHLSSLSPALITRRRRRRRH